MFDIRRDDAQEASSYDPMAAFAMLMAPGALLPSGDWPRHVLEDLPAAIYTTDRFGRITFFNKAAAALAGRTPVLGVDEWCVTWKLFLPDGTPLPHDECPMAVALKENRTIRGVEAIAERPDGTRVPFTPFPTPLHDGSGRLVGGVNMLLDISSHKAAEERIAYLASTDLLTELPNRAALASRLSAMVHAGQAFSLISVDLDGFKDINDAFGLLVGDEVLRHVGQRLTGVVNGVFASRAGDDEFTLLVPGVESETAVALIVERLQAAVGQDLVVGGRVFNVGFSAGVARFPKDADNEVDLIGDANTARCLAKREDRGSLRFFDTEINGRVQARQALRCDLQAAIGTDALRLHFQPQVRPNGVVVGFEVLVRWVHAVRGNVPPDEFIPLAEESGLIIPLSRWILRAACAEAATWTSGLKVSVNLSPMQFQHDDLADLVRSILADTGLAASRLVLEVTEGVLIADYARAMTILTELCALGVEIALDDFGTGYSSLSYLQEFPFSEIKIDRNFTAKLGICARSMPIVRSVIELGHALGLRVVAEGVETAAQIEFLATTQCDLVQGYLTGRPANIEAYSGVTGVAA